MQAAEGWLVVWQCKGGEFTHLLPVEAATVVFGQGSEGGTHLPAL